jgi:hypothetical protein
VRPLPTGGDRRHRFVDTARDARGVHRAFLEERVRPTLERLDAELRAARQHDDRNVCYRTESLEAGGSGRVPKREVEEQTTEASFAESLFGFVQRTHRDDLGAVAINGLQGSNEEVPVVRIVLDHEETKRAVPLT